MCFYGSKLSPSAIYKIVNSKLYLLRMSSFFNLYLHNCSSNLFFLYGFKYSDIFCCSWYFLVDLFFHTVFSGLNYRLDLTKKKKKWCKRQKYFATVDYYTLKFYIMKIYNSLYASMSSGVVSVCCGNLKDSPPDTLIGKGTPGPQTRRSRVAWGWIQYTPNFLYK